VTLPVAILATGVVASCLLAAFILITDAGRRLGGAGLALVVGSVLRVRRRHVEEALRRAGLGPAPTLARAMYARLGEHLLEVLSLLLSPRVLQKVQIPHAELRTVRGGGRGAVIATAHTGNWDLTACALARHVPLTVVTRRLSVKPLDRLWQRLRGRSGVRLVTEGQASQAARHTLARGGIVAMMVDQVPLRDRGVIRVPFLGAPAPVDLGPALIALRARVPLVAAFPLRTPDGSHHVVVCGVIEPPRVPARQWAEQSMQKVTAWLEAFVRAHPEQWLWMHRRWWSYEQRRLGVGPRGALGTAPCRTAARAVIPPP
jgi:Kdo2-lipid IVA lauroyltransferase/acyltransferase